MKFLEEKVMELNSRLPQLPENSKAKLASVFWIIAIISIVVNILGILTILGVGLFSTSILVSFGQMTFELLIIILVGVIGMGVTVVMEVTAVGPLKRMEYRGWYISFMVIWLQFGFGILNNLFSTTSTSRNIFSTIITSLLSLYLLVQVREYFTEN